MAKIQLAVLTSTQQYLRKSIFTNFNSLEPKIGILPIYINSYKPIFALEYRGKTIISTVFTNPSN
jgi:hypothetical protein